ncbi:MAG TPA: folylpolyglutamate synthase/dihydrofolate synthase family protein [Bacteroidota bacterium]|nr:folylpolyglutamate synthase/dihydrofolate synthase family protein [Bacteroidota bacterium]
MSTLSFDEAVGFLYGLQKSGMKFGLRNIRRLLRAFGNPERSFRSIHIAGSNGKGSTASMIASVLSAAGYRTGLYTSPHLVSFRERIRVNGRPIAPADIVRLVGRLRGLVKRHNVTFFETTTALAFQYFREQKADFVVVETGLGGRLDATNVVLPEAVVITTISREHTEILGNLIRKIAYEKAGTIKRGIPCVTGVRSRTALGVLRATARSREAPLFHSSRVKMRVKRQSIRGTRMDVEVEGRSYKNLFLDLPGLHQTENARIALLALHVLREKGIIRLPEKSVREGIGQVRRRTGLRSRLSVIQSRPAIMTDVAHNPAGVRTLVAELKRLRKKNVVLVFGVMKDKKYRPMIAALRAVASSVVVVQPKTERARDVADLRRGFKAARVPVVFSGSVRDGMTAARRKAGATGTVLVTGSHFVVGEALALLEGKKYLTINQ